MKLVNLTPHPVMIRPASGPDITIPPSGSIARVASTAAQTESLVIDGIEIPTIGAPVWGPIEGLPDPEPGVAYIVSILVLGRVTGRPDVLAPATGPKDGAVRDAEGRILGVTKLVRA